MSARIIDGQAIARQIKDELLPRIAALKAQGVVPGLAAVLIGDNPASQAYVNMKTKAFAALGLYSETFFLPKTTTMPEVLHLIDNLNHNPQFHGILVQLPLPDHLDSNQVIELITPLKDADGLHPINIGRMLLGMEAPLPCTPHGILMLLKYSDIDPAGKRVVVLGRSNIVGKPVANLLFQKRSLGNATVTVCHTQTPQLAEISRQADILIAAIGKPEFVKADFVKTGAVVIDVGSNRIPAPDTPKGYRFVGDVKFDEVVVKASAITPVPGGVGPMTITMLIYNTVYLCEKQIK
jgi:methylenetetrahydrofolate dehydrogenase (NADP+)/methenyltetrahydrofolate cyclohydrolase